MTPADSYIPESREFDAEKALSPWVEMWNSYDLRRVDDLFARDSVLSYFSSEKEGVILGIDAVREHHKGFGFVEGGKSSDNRLWLEGLFSAVYGSTALVTGIWFFRRGNGQEMRGPVTFVFSQEAGEHRLVHLHFGNYR
ncbi:hypothetical protein ACFL5A_05085 [Gemmatimonadota bacterium]